MNIETKPEIADHASTAPAAAVPGILEKLANIRGEIDAVTAEIDWVVSSPIPKSELKRRIDDLAVDFMGRFQLPLYQLADPQMPRAAFHEMMVAHGRSNIEGSNACSINLTEMLMGLFGDELLVKMHRQVDAMNYAAGPESKTRPAALKKLNATLRELGEKEEELICAAEKRGTIIPRRADADPAIVLGYTP